MIEAVGIIQVISRQRANATIAEELAPHIGAVPGARTLESDRLRKAVFKVPAKSILPEKAYTEEISEQVYLQLAQRGQQVVSKGQSVIVNAVYSRIKQRYHIANCANKIDVPFLGIWLNADPETLRKRVRDRKKGPSDATENILNSQLQHLKALPDDWVVISSAGTIDTIVRTILDLCK